jgi:hypothetical protein
MLSCTINAKEKWDVATVDIPGAFMQTDMEDTVHIGRATGQARPETIPKTCENQERKADHVCTA